MKEKNKRNISWCKRTAAFLLLAIFMSVSSMGLPVVSAANPGSVVINEIAWAGTADSAYDEWLELYNPTSQTVDLSGWKINNNNGAAIYNLSGSIATNGYYLIEDTETSVKPNVANAVINISLSNSGVSLALEDGVGGVIDAVNTAGAAWFAGNSTSKLTMERKDALVSGDLASNWASYGGSGGPATGSNGSLIMGTPGALNSVSAPPLNAQKISLSLSAAAPNVGDLLTVTAKAENLNDLFAYGIELDYDPTVLSFVSALKGPFLSESEGVETSFQNGLENGAAGKLLVAEARTIATKAGVSGGGDLFSAQFTVIGGAGAQSVLSFAPTSFAADTNGDLSVIFSGASFNSVNVSVDPVTGLQAVQGTERYSIKLSWVAPTGGADKYKVSRQDPHGVWKALGETTQLEFTDSDAVSAGGKIIPDVMYSYRVTALKGTVESSAAEIAAKDIRGLKGDNNRSDRVDGRDLEKLARHFTQTDADAGFDALVDTTYDGQVNGSDLIDLGVNFAQVYP